MRTENEDQSLVSRRSALASGVAGVAAIAATSVAAAQEQQYVAAAQEQQGRKRLPVTEAQFHSPSVVVRVVKLGTQNVMVATTDLPDGDFVLSVKDGTVVANEPKDGAAAFRIGGPGPGGCWHNPCKFCLDNIGRAAC